MKRLLLLFLITLSSVSLWADLVGDDYYRVQNAYTGRYAYLVDNTGYVHAQSTSADVQALELYSGILRASSDPATIFYISAAPSSAGSGSFYDIAAQGTSIHSFLGEYMKIIKAKTYENKQAYYAYASKSGMTKYLGDRMVDLTSEKGLSSVEATGNTRLWYIHPVDSSDDSYFGIAPTVTAGGKYYYPFYADFPFAPCSDGIKFYYVKAIDHVNKIAVMGELKSTVAPGVPVIVECSHPLAVDNRLKIGNGASNINPADNKLKGVYFDNPNERHYNRTPYDRQSMRTLGVVDGKLSFVVSDIDFLPRNQAYLQLTHDYQYGVANYTLMEEAEYESNYNAVDIITESAVVDVYSLDGRLIKSGIAKTDVPSLGKGLYILKCGSISEKLIVR